MTTRPSLRHRTVNSRSFDFEKLEIRTMLSTGASFLPPLAPQFTGVVDYSTAGGGRCTATLLADGRHILTAAHCVDGDDNGIPDPGNHGFTFELPNGDITFTVPGSQINIAPGWDGTTKNGSDIAIAELLEIGAGGASNGHDLYRMNNEVGQTYTAVGYGQSGSSGNVGNSNPSGTKRSFQNQFDSDATPILNEVKSVEVAATGGNFRLQFGGNNTANIVWNAGTGTVQAALNALPSIGGVGGVVNVFGAPGLWFVNFAGTFAGNDVGSLSILAGGLVGATVADVDTEIDGGEYSMPGNEGLLYDFDNGADANDALGQLYGINDLGLGNLTEAIQSPGDSGSPFFLGVNELIAGVVSRRETNIGRGADPIQQPVDISGNDSTFGEIGVLARVFSFTAWIDGQVDDNNIDLVLNMNNQDEGNNGVADTIEARINGGMFELLVNGQLFYQDMPGQIDSLQVIGSSDADSLIISDPLGFNVTFDGDAGNDTLDISALISQTVSLTGVGVTDGLDGTTASVVSMFENVEKIVGSLAGNNDQVTGLDQAADWIVDPVNGQYQSGGQTVGLMNFEIYVGGNDDDVFQVTGLGGPVSVDGQLGNDTLDDDSGTPNVFVINGNNAGSLNVLLDFSSVENLAGDSDTDLFDFSVWSLDGTIDGEAGIDTFDYADGLSETILLSGTGLIDGLDGTVDSGNFVSSFHNMNEIKGSSGQATDTIYGLDEENSWSFDDTFERYVAMDSGRTLHLMDFDSFIGGNAIDTFRDDDFTRPLTIDGRDGFDQLANQTQDPGLFIINEPDAGLYNGLLGFESIEYLNGGFNDDEFRFVNNGFVSLQVDGNNGYNHFNFAAMDSQTINLTTFDNEGFRGNADGNLVQFVFIDINKITASAAGLNDRINAFDLDATWEINNNSVSYTINPTLDLENFEIYWGGEGLDTFNVRATDSEIVLRGWGNDDLFTLSSNAPALTGNLNDIQGKVNILGGSGNNRLRVSDYSGHSNPNVEIHYDFIRGLAPVDIFFLGTFDRPLNDGIWIKGSNFAVDNFNIHSLESDDSLTIEANGGNDSIFSHDLVLGDLWLDGGEGSDLIDIEFVDAARRVEALDSGFGDVDTLIVKGLLTADHLVVRNTSVSRNVVERIWYDNNTENLHVLGRGGDEVINFAGSNALATIVNTGDGDDFIQVIDTGNLLVLNIRMGRDTDVVRIEKTRSFTHTFVDTQHDRDYVFVGSNLTMNNGSLDRIIGPLSVDGGSNLVGEDRLYINDRDTATGQIYGLNDSEIFSVSPRDFSSLSHSQFEVVRLDGTDQADEYQVTPSTLNRFVVDGNLPTSHGIACAAEGDYLNLMADADSGRKLFITDQENGNGAWTFTNGLQGVFFTSIERFNHVSRLAIGSDAFLHSVIRVLDAESRNTFFNLLPFESTFTGGVRVATGDVSGDGIPDIIAAPGAGRPPQVRIFDGLDGHFIGSFLAYDSNMWDGILLDVGDITGTCGVDIVTTTGPGPANAEIRVFENRGANGFQMVDHFLPFGDHFTGGADIAVGDFNHDGTNDIAAGKLHGQADVVVFDGSVPGGAYELARFRAFGDDFFGGVHLAAGNLIGGDHADLIVSTGHNAWAPLYDSRVHIYNGNNLAYTPFVYDAPEALFFAFTQNQNADASTRIAVKDYDLDGAIDELFASQGLHGDDGRINVFEPLNPVAIDSLFETGQPFTGGIFVG